MERMCLSSLLCDEKKNQDDNAAGKMVCFDNMENLSPTITTVTQSRKSSLNPYIDDEFPSYQIVRGSKRFSDMSEEQESIWPISPINTPPRIQKKENFQVPFVPTLGTIVKKNATSKVTPSDNSHVIPTKESTKNCKSSYEELGMVDNDISWNSSMETPTHKLLSLGDYNTIERATLLPERDQKNMQPRVLFSPYENDDSECLPLKYSSESEDEKDNCSTKLQGLDEYDINLKTSTSGSLKGTAGINSPVKNENSPKTAVTSDSFIKNSVLSQSSPVFKVSKKKSKIKKQKLLVKSPDISVEDNQNSCNESVGKTKKNIICDNNLCEKVPVVEMKETNKHHDIYVNENSETFQDDSLQNISFSCFEELCNTSDFVSDFNLTHNTNTSPAEKKHTDFGRKGSQNYNSGKNISPVQEKGVKNKLFFYDSSRTDEMQPVTSLDDFLKSAKQLEDFTFVELNKPCPDVDDDELTLCNKMVSGEFSEQDQKRVRLVSRKSPNTCHEKMEISNKSEAFPECAKNEEKIEVKHVKNQDSIKAVTNQCGINNSQICMTAICRERLVDSKKNLSCYQSTNFGVNEQTNNYHSVKKYVGNSENGRTGTQTMFFNTLDKLIPLSNELNEKDLNIFEQDTTNEVDNKEDNMRKSDFQGFKTASGVPVKISENSLNKAKKLFLEPDVNIGVPVNNNSAEYSGFTTASGMKVTFSEESLKKAKNVFRDFDGIDFQENTTIMTEVTPKEFIGFKTASNNPVKISEESLKRANELWKQMEDISVDKSSCLFQSSESKGSILKDNTSLALEAGVKSYPRIKSHSTSYGFSTASGKNLTVSKNALKEARKILGEEIEDSEKKDMTSEKREPVRETTTNEEISFTQECEEEKLENSELIPPWLHAYSTSPTITMEPTLFNSVKSSEDFSRHSTPKEHYLIKGPVLDRTDRFFNKRKRRKTGKKLFFKPLNHNTPAEDENISDHACLKNPSIKRGSSELDIDFTVPFKKKKFEADEGNSINVRVTKLSFEVIDGRKKARLEQVQAGKKLKVNPVQGSHIVKKRQKQLSWYEALQGTSPGRYSDEVLKNYGVRSDVLQITASNAISYRFKAEDFFTPLDCSSNINGFPVGDECLLIFDDNNTAGVEEIIRAFFASSGVEPNLISPEWVKNHYKWIVWKFNHYERSFPHVFGGNCLTPHNVMVQLKYRYDREIDGSERSSLKKILEQDESSRNRIVLCVYDIKKCSDLCNKSTESSHSSIISYVLELTDGWYSCCAQTDSAMLKLIEEEKVIIGTKLVTHGAELLANEGVAPLEGSDEVKLKIFTNSTRRAKWDTKLGFQKNKGPFLVSLNSILPNGGLVGRLDVVIMRIYPVLYMEKKPDGTHVLRNSRTEDKAILAYQEQQEAVIEKIYQQIKDEMKNKAKEKKFLKKVTLSDVSKITDPEELFRLYEGCSDPSSFQDLLTLEQNKMLVDYQMRMKQIDGKELSDMVQEKMKIAKMNTRKVSQLLRIKIVDLHNPDYDNPVLLTIWNSTEEVSQMLSEGKAISVFNTVPHNSRLHKPVQLNTTRYTHYKELTKIVEYPVRKLTSFGELTADYEPLFNEIDVVGIVVYICETSYGSRMTQTIYLADLEYNFVGLVFWGSCKSLGWENVLTVGSIVACSNLQWSNKRYFNGIPNVYVTDSSVFKENPKENFLKEGIKALKSSLPEDMKNFIRKCEDEVIGKLDEHKLSNASKNISNPYDSSNNSSSNILKPKYANGFKMRPNASSTPFKSRVFGLDTSDQEPSPIQKRIEKLQMYGEPPPLPPLPLDNSNKVNKKFKPPFKTVVDPSAK